GEKHQRRILMKRSRPRFVLGMLLGFSLALAFANAPAVDYGDGDRHGQDEHAAHHDQDALSEGRRTFRFDTFGDEDFWGGTLKLHQAIEGSAFGGVGAGVSPKTALAVGLKVDVDALPAPVLNALRSGKVDLDDPAVTLTLLKLNAVVGVTGFFQSGLSLKSIGIQCALCHSTVDNSFAPGIGHRLDGWANRDLNVGAIVSLAPDLSAVADLLRVDQNTVRTVLGAWQVRCRAAARRHWVSAGRENRGDADTSRIRPRWRESAHLDGVGVHPLLERVRCDVGNARQG